MYIRQILFLIFDNVNSIQNDVENLFFFNILQNVFDFYIKNFRANIETIYRNLFECFVQFFFILNQFEFAVNVINKIKRSKYFTIIILF